MEDSKQYLLENENYILKYISPNGLTCTMGILGLGTLIDFLEKDKKDIVAYKYKVEFHLIDKE